MNEDTAKDMTIMSMDLVGQFVLCRTKEAIPERWDVRRNGEWYLGSHPSLPITDIVDADSSRVGWLMGWPLGIHAQLTRGSLRFDVLPNSANAPKQFESALDTGKGYIGLTAGRDTRVLLACGRNLLDRLELFTLAIPNASGQLDIQIASRTGVALKARRI